MGDDTPIEADLGEITRRLAEIDLLLDTEASEPSALQFELLQERDHLRGLAHTFRSEPDRERSVAQLEAERDALRLVLGRETRDRTGYVSGMGGGNQGAAPGAWVELGARSLQAGDLPRIVARISAIEDELARRSAS
jgi:hypothetical protein